MTARHEDLDRCSQALYEARRSGVPIPPLTHEFPDWGVAEGYAVQQGLVERLIADGERIVGYKLGLTSTPMQELLGVDQPDFSPIFASGVLSDGAELSVGDFIAPRVEAEIAVVLADDLHGPDCTSGHVARATRGLTSAIEIVDSRIADWQITIADTVADLASGGAIVLGSQAVALTAIDPRLIGMVFTRNGQLVATGAGAAALGNPLAAVAWLANTLHPHGGYLPAGSVVMTGALHAMKPISPGETWTGEFDRLGPVSLSVTE
jgi:2-keto-4-pentenoate hydratase